MKTPPDRAREIPIVHLVVGVAMTLLVIASHVLEGDPQVFMLIAERIAKGAIPYVDYPVEYPPLALLHIFLPRLIGGPSAANYQTIFSIISLALAIGTGAAVYWLARRHWSVETPTNALLVFIGLALAGAPLVVWRYDILPTFLTAMALVALASGRSVWAGLALGLGTAAKLYPAFLVPVLAAAPLVGRRLRPAALIVVGAAISVGAVALELFLVAGPGAFSFLLYQEERGVEIESITGGIALLADVLGGPVSHVAIGFGSWQVVSPVLGAIALPRTLFEAALVIALAAGGWISFRRDVRLFRAVRPQTLVTYSLATLLLVILTNKVLSPQYLVWLLPFGALMPRRQSLLLLATIALTTLIYPLSFRGLTYVEAPAVVALNVRNAMLVALFVWVVIPRRTEVVADDGAASDRSDVRDATD